MRFRPLWILALLAALGFVYTPSARAGGVVSTCDEPSLLAALTGGGTVTFTCSGTITVTATITPASNTTIDGTGQNVTISGGGAVQVMSIPGGVTVKLNELTITRGFFNGISNGGGGISNGGTLTVTNSTISNNGGFSGGGILNGGTVRVTNSSFSGNNAFQGGGVLNNGTMTVSNSTFSGANAIYGAGILNVGTLTVTNSTFSGNGADTGGGIANFYGVLTVTNSTFSGNSAAFGSGIGSFFNSGQTTLKLQNTLLANNSGADCTDQSTIIDGGGNLSWPDTTCPGINQNPLLDPNGLRNNGGPTQTIALLLGSPAINAAVSANCPATDQRGVPRPPGMCDIGAYQLSPADEINPIVNTVNALVNAGTLNQGQGNS